MSEKKTELRLAVGSVGAIVTMVLAAIGAAAKALVDAGAIEQGSAWYAVAVGVAAAAGALGAAKISTEYSRSRADVKSARAVATADALRPLPPKPPQG